MGRSNFPAGSKGFRDAVDARPAIMKDALSNELKQIECNGINIFKQVEMTTKYKKIIPVEDRVDILYETPCAEVMNAVKKEKEMRKSSRQQIDAEKRKVSKKLKMEQWDLSKINVRELIIIINSFIHSTTSPPPNLVPQQRQKEAEMLSGYIILLCRGVI